MERKIRVTTLLENTTKREDLAAAHGLSLFIETPRHRILFDMGPNEAYLENAEKLGVDLETVDLAILSHGHYDHGGGLAAFCRKNTTAPVYIREGAFGAYYALDGGGKPPRYIGLDPALSAFRDRFRLTKAETVIDEELTLFAEPPMLFDALGASAKLREKTEEGFCTDDFAHEQNLLVQVEGKTLIVAGCAHRGSVNILAEAKRRLGKDPDLFFGGFHLFELDPGAESDALIDATGQALLTGTTQYYTGHCTGPYAYQRLSGILGDRLRAMSGGVTAEL